MSTLCPTCKKMLYRTDPCRGAGICGRTDGGSKRSAGASRPNEVVPRERGEAKAIRSSRTGTDEPAPSPKVPVDGKQAEPGLGTTPLTTRGTPRRRAPKGSFDRKSYQREWARKRRAAKRACTGTVMGTSEGSD